MAQTHFKVYRVIAEAGPTTYLVRDLNAPTIDPDTIDIEIWKDHEAGDFFLVNAIYPTPIDLLYDLCSKHWGATREKFWISHGNLPISKHIVLNELFYLKQGTSHTPLSFEYCDETEFSSYLFDRFHAQDQSSQKCE